MSAGGGNGDGFEGGDPLVALLTARRSEIRVALEQIVSGRGANQVCRYDVCDRSQEACQSLNRLSDSQVSSCRKMLVDGAQVLLDRINDSGVELRPVIGPIESTQDATSPSAATALGALGSIQFDRTRAMEMGADELRALVVHEFGHKVLFGGGYIVDADPVGNFSTGRELLDTVGKALVAYAKVNRPGVFISKADLVRLYRLHRNAVSDQFPDAHFFTISPAERNAVAASGFSDESDSTNLKAYATPQPYSEPVFRLFNEVKRLHFYTRDRGERSARLASGWRDEGVAFHLIPFKFENSVEVFSLSNQQTGGVLFTNSITELNEILRLFPATWLHQNSWGFHPTP